jgi:hypothetical protein
MVRPTLSGDMSATAPAGTETETQTQTQAQDRERSEDPAGLSEKQRRILAYLRERVDEQTYFKSRLIGEDLDLSAKEVGSNMTALCEGDLAIKVEKWGYSSGTTWMVTQTQGS